MTANRELTYSDLVEANERRDPQFAELVIRYLDQPDPPEDRPEEPSDQPVRSLPDDAWTLARLRSALSDSALWGKSLGEKQAARREAWQSLMTADHPPPRLKLADLLIGLYAEEDEWARAALIEIFSRGRIGWGLWRGLKKVYKLAEERHDAEMFGLLAWRLDSIETASKLNEVSRGTFNYMKRRAWRYLRQLGQALPELYPQFAVQVLRHYQSDFRFYSSWVANQIWAHKDLIGARSAWYSSAPKDLGKRAFDEAWKLSPEPLLRLLEDAGHDAVCDFAIRSLKADFPEVLRNVDPAWLGRIGGKRLASVDEFVISLLEASPELHQSKLAKLGLHEMVIGFLRSDSSRANAYAVEYANSHAPDIPVDELVTIGEEKAGDKKVLAFVVARLEKIDGKKIGLKLLVRMLGVGGLSGVATAKLKRSFTPADIDEETYVELMLGGNAEKAFINELYKEHKTKVPASFLRAHAEHPRLAYWAVAPILRELGKRSGAEIGLDWIKQAVFDPRYSSEVQGWLLAGKLKGEELDVDWLKELIMRPMMRDFASRVLGNRELVAPYRVGFDWLLGLAGHSDAQLAEFAHGYLLRCFAPDDIALEMNATEIEVGIVKLWSLFAKEQPASVRRFAATYLSVHHPEMSPTMAETRQYGVTPQLPLESYTLERIRPLFFDHRADVRRFAAAVGRYHLVKWGEPALVYQLTGSSHRETRAIGAQALLACGEPDADPGQTVPESWLEPARVFAMAESSVKATREVAVTLIRRHYTRLGGVNRLAWLMDSPDREVRLFAVRLLWEQHRPLPGPRGANRDRFDSVAALQLFLRTVLFGLPPGRMERREGGDAMPERPLPSSVAKRRLIEVVRDMAIEDREFAAVVTPVLEEFVNSRAKGEWQGCVAAIARMRKAHPQLETSLPPSGSA